MQNKLPQYIINAIRRRAAAAEKWHRADEQITAFCSRLGIDTEFIDGHVETLVCTDPDVFIRDIEEHLKITQKGVH